MSTLSEIMSDEVYSTTAETSVADAAKGMVQGRFGSAVVIESGWLVGILTERDVLRAAASGTDLTRSSVADWMTKDPVTSTPDTASEEAAEIMLSQGFRHLPVVEGNKVLGIVSLRDLLSARIRRPAT